MHARKSGAMEKTGLIPRFEIIGRFNLTNVPHAISRWTTYERHDGKMYSFKNKKKILIPDRKLGFTRPIFFIYLFIYFLF